MLLFYINNVYFIKNIDLYEVNSMRLLYWYTRFLDKFGNPRIYHGLKSFELNFSTQTRYHFDSEKRELVQEPYDTPLPHDFWGNQLLYNINAIVGNNGVGKSTVINTMMKVLQEIYDRKVKREDETIFIIECDERPLLYHQPSSIKLQCDFIEQIDNLNNNLKEESLRHIDCTKLIFLTNTISESDDKRYYSTNNQPHVRANFIYDCSLIGTMRYDAKDDCYINPRNDHYLHPTQNNKHIPSQSIYHDSPQDILHTYFVSEYYKQVKLVCDKTQYTYLSHLKERGLPVPVPKILSITIRDYNNDYKDLFDLSLGVKAQKTVSEKLAYRLCASCFYAFLDNIRRYNYPVPSKVEPPESTSVEAFQTLLNTIEIDFIHDAIISRWLHKLQSYCLDFVSLICSNKKQLECFNITQIELDSIDQGLPATLELTINEDIMDWLEEFMDYYRRTCVPYYYLDFSWELSSGEENLLRLFASLFYAFDSSNKNLYNWSDGKRKSQCDSVILIMDEADLTFHPEWQRQLIQILTAFLPLEFGHCGVNDLQVILTTHSPLLLGDIPANNVIYLGDNESQNVSNVVRNTFGQNIHTILKDSFFLANGTLGAFAADKINNTADKLRHFEKMTPQEIKECKSIVDLVAPGILKSKLTELYEKAVNKKALPLEESIKESAGNLSDEELTGIIGMIQAEIKRRQK